MKKLILILGLFLTISVNAQIYSTSRYYSQRGSTDKIYSECYYNYQGILVREYQYRVWQQEYFSGNVYMWNGYNWVYQWQQGYYWRFTWSPVYTTYC